MNSENSALLALSELKNLEAMRVQKEEDDLKAREDAARRAREDAERRAREEVERREREEAERLAREHAEREAREREERIRVQEAEARARAEGEARLKEEQLRIDAQMRMAEKKARPTWPLYVVPALVVGLGAVGYLAWNHAEQVEDASAQIAEEKKRNEEKEAALLAIQQKLEQLES
jgi:membrane protein involved in colicin uptake